MTEQGPKHIAIIMDGNRRWAKNNGLSTKEGHTQGAKNLELLLNKANELGVECLTAWGFSTENWKRSKQEVDGLWSLVKDYANYYRKLCLDNEIRLIHIGRKDRLPSFILKLISEVEEETKHFTRIFAPAFDYGGHDEIVRAINRVQEKGLEVSEKTIEANLDTATLPPVDLIIRTGDVVRLSGFLSWQSEYAEYYFSQKMFPDFGTEDLEDAVMQFCKIERRFGGDGALAIAKK